MQVFILNELDFSLIGESFNAFSGCISSADVKAVSNQYQSSAAEGVSCSVNSGCEATNQLQAQIGTISTSIGVAGGGGVGCFCGSCLIAVLFYRRKKKKIAGQATVESMGTSTFNSSDLFTANRDLTNPLFENS